MLPLYLLRPGTWFRFAEENDQALYESVSCKPGPQFVGSDYLTAIAKIRLVGQETSSILSWGCVLVRPFSR